jgi:PTH1 family peptidyl-tRNA hydrolase
VKIVVGLGNPGKRYAQTPHNAGFLVVDRLAGLLGWRLRRSLRFPAQLGRGRRNDEPVWLLKPLTYMNDSGRAVGAALRYLRAAAGDLIVVLDDADLPLGRLRVRPAGSSGGHKGLASVMAQAGTDAFARIRVGIGRSGDGSRDLVGHVLSPFSAAEREVMAAVVDQCAQAVLCMLDFGAAKAMNQFNGAVIGAADPH